MKKALLLTALVASFLLVTTGCSQKQLVINGMICPEGHTDELVKNDFSECHYYDLAAAGKASKTPITIECQKCLESKGYKIEQ